ncbi:MAG: alpha-beta hydrolase superfamily lysophospholipase [Phenylobacterium sp.]|jgi:alpha-beta hydrolase superfamily lysophospholipase
MIEQQSLYIPDGAHQLHLRHVSNSNASDSSDTRAKPGQPVLLVHGAIENGLIFYTKKGKGLACYLAGQGFDVYVLDLRGRGETKPRIQPFDDYGQTETIKTDLPLFIDFIYQRNPQPIHLMAHSWGGVLVTAMLARAPQYLSKVRSQVFFGTKRKIKVVNIEVLFKISLMWRLIAPVLARRVGFLPAKKIGFGSDDETIKSHSQGMHWTKSKAWIDSDDNFDYHQACADIQWPPTWFIAAVNDKALGHPKDVKGFMDEANYGEAKYTLLAKAGGFAQDYDHISMLTAAGAVDDHFVQIAQWLKGT